MLGTVTEGVNEREIERERERERERQCKQLPLFIQKVPRVVEAGGGGLPSHRSGGVEGGVRGGGGVREPNRELCNFYLHSRWRRLREPPLYKRKNASKAGTCQATKC